METVRDLLTDKEIEIAFANADFGDIEYREVVKYTLLQYACGFTSGNFARAILRELGLITSSDILTKKGKRYLFAAFNKGNSF